MASSAMLWVTTGGSEFLLRANTRRLRRILSSDDRRSSELGTSVPCSLKSAQPSSNTSRSLPRVPGGVLKDSFTDSSGDLVDRFSQLLRNGLTLKRLDGVRVGSRWHDDESDDSGFRAHLLKTSVQTWRQWMPPWIPTPKYSRASDSMNMSTPLFLNS